MNNTLLLIAYGNPLRRDDGAGLALGAQLATAWQAVGIAVRHLALHQLTPEVALEVSAPDLYSVLFVDTTAEPLPDLQLVPLAPATADNALGHHLTPATLLLYAQHLYGHCPPAWLLTIPGVDFGFGEGLSATTTEQLTTAAAHAGDLLTTLLGNISLEGDTG
ncbi:MAG: hypothetical protein R2867_07380 [Caldilineaceae bacterium]